MVLLKVFELTMYKFISGILFLTFLFSCGKENYTISNINGGRIDVLGHGGMGYNSSFPMNSFESLILAINSGADGTEMDVQLTKDSVLITFHDEFLESKTNGDGRMIDYNWEQLSNIHYDEAPFDHYALTSLDKVLTETSSENNLSLTFDCKVYPSSSEELNEHAATFARQLKNEFDKHELHDKVIIEASSIALIDKLRALDTNIRILYYPESFQVGYQVALDKGLHGITMSMHKITKEEIHQAHAAGLFVAIWQCRTKKNNREAIRMNPDMIQSDKLKHLVNELR